MNTKFIKTYIKEFFENNDKALPTLKQEEDIYTYLLTARKLFHKEGVKRVDFFQLWQQKQFISDLERSIRTLENTNCYAEVEPKDKKNKKCFIILPELNKLIRIDFRKGTRKFLGWVEYSEKKLK